MALVPVNGIELNVEVQGQGMPVFMLHGFTGDITTWQPLADTLSKQYMTVLVDLIGHGRSDAPQDPERYSMKQCVEDMLTLADRLGIEEAVWIGYSMGGRVSLCLGVTAPGKCRALVLEGASGGIEDEVEREARVLADRTLAKRIEEEGVGWFVDYWEYQEMFASQTRLDDETRLRLRRQRLGNRVTGLANSLRGMGTGVQPSVYGKLSSFDRPALFLAGEEDRKFVEVGRWMSELTPKGKFESISDAGHCAHLENPQQFREKVFDFLEALESAPRREPVRGARGRSVV